MTQPIKTPLKVEDGTQPVHSTASAGRDKKPVKTAEDVRKMFVDLVVGP